MPESVLSPAIVRPTAQIAEKAPAAGSTDAEGKEGRGDAMFLYTIVPMECFVEQPSSSGEEIRQLHNRREYFGGAGCGR